MSIFSSEIWYHLQFPVWTTCFDRFIFVFIANLDPNWKQTKSLSTV